MQTKLTTQEKLKDLRVARRLRLEDLAAQTGLSKSALGEYELNETKDISLYAITNLAKFYGVSTDYLLGLTENKNHPNTELCALHLSDEMIDLLKSGRLNNRLLCEMALHPGFLQLMTDIEICVDRIADMRVESMNQALEQARQEIIQKYTPQEPDLHLRTLELAQVQEEIFFSHIFHKELDEIVRDIRKAHEKDTMTADKQTTQAEQAELEQKMQEILNSSASLQQKRARAVAVAMKLDYDRLAESD